MKITKGVLGLVLVMLVGFSVQAGRTVIDHWYWVPTADEKHAMSYVPLCKHI